MLDVQGPFRVEKEAGPRGVIAFRLAAGVSIGEGLLERRGCYVFVLARDVKGRSTRRTPVYAGKATETFKQEIFQQHKQELLDEATNGVRGRIELFLFPVEVGPGPAPAKAIDEAESYLIRECFELNDQLRNKRKLGKRTWEIRGVTGSGRGRPKAAVQAFNGMWE
jgi:hypothetical protein